MQLRLLAVLAWQGFWVLLGRHGAKGWASRYFGMYVRTVIWARVLLMRSSETLSRRQARILERVAKADRSPPALLWLLGRSLRPLWGRNEAFGRELLVLSSALWGRALELRSRPRRSPRGSEAMSREEGQIVLSNDGYCAVCDAPSHFTARDPWLRDHYRCDRCGSIPRERALLTVLEREFPNWRDLSIHESSPGLPSSDRLRRLCDSYVATHYFPDVPVGTIERGVRNEDLSRQTFPDECFDLVITQDVMEHVLDPEGAFREIARTLRPGGAHVFTTPIYPGLTTSERRARSRNGEVEYLAEPEYHGNPIDAGGSLVTMHWGQDITGIISRSSGLATRVHVTVDRSLGIDGSFIEVLVSRKPPVRVSQAGRQAT
jgi:hypothetical protein